MSNPSAAAISGFPELLPAQRIVEQRALDLVRETFELHGFASVETRAVEPLAWLASKGEVEKEVYVLRRLHAAADAPERPEDQLGLHFDLTVPTARYVVEHAGHLTFPWRRYQIQKVWRGERPQQGRYREFTQADIDIIGRDTLAPHHDAEAMLVMVEVFERLHAELGLPPVVVRVNNRKLCEGFYRGLGADDPGAVLQRIDKLDKIGPEKVAALLVDETGLTREQAERCLALAAIRTEDVSFVEQVRALGVESELLEEGLAELADVVATAVAAAPGRVVADLSIARGLDYYTGTVYETQLVGHPELGSVSSGGRYDRLAADKRSTYPGVGISLGVTRLLVPLLQAQRVTATRSVPSCVLVAVDDEESRADAVAVAGALRRRGIATEVAPRADKFGKQIRHAERRGIPFVWFGGEQGEVKDIRSGEQSPADAAAWEPPAADRRPRIVTADDAADDTADDTARDARP